MGGTAVISLTWAALADKFQLLVPGLWLVAALLLGAAVIALLKHWRGRGRAGCLTPGDQLAHFRSLYEKGARAAEEFDRLRELLGGQLRRELNLPPPPADAPAAAPDDRVMPAPGDRKPPAPPPDDGIRPA